MSNIHQGCQLPWLIFGDFNLVLKMDDRIGVNPITMGEVVDFQDCVNTCEWIELPKQGSRYTWNDRHGDQRIFFKIDWVFVNRDWMDQMLAYNTIILPEGMSDHCPISVKLTNAPWLSRRPFKFCNTWAQHPQFLTKVQTIWNQQMEVCEML